MTTSLLLLAAGRGASILVEGQRCMIVSLTRSEPPRRHRKKHAA